MPKNPHDARKKTRAFSNGGVLTRMCRLSAARELDVIDGVNPSEQADYGECGGTECDGVRGDHDESFREVRSVRSV